MKDMKNMKCIMCGDELMIKGTDENEVMEMAKMHWKSKHKKNLTTKDMKDMMNECAKEMAQWE